MPHRPPKPVHFDSEIEIINLSTGDAKVLLPANHPKHPHVVVGKIIKNSTDENHYTVYSYDAEQDKLRIPLGSFTSIGCAVARIEYRDGRLTTKYEKEFACPDCGQFVKTIMLGGVMHKRPIPKLVNTEVVPVVVDTWNTSTYSAVVGHRFHECEKEAE